MDATGEQKVKLSDIAADWGCSVAYVSRMKNERGCPVESLEAAREWRIQNAARGGTGYRSRGQKKSPARESEGVSAEIEPISFGPVKKKSLKSMEQSLKASVEIEENAKWLVDRAIALDEVERLPLLLQSYNKAKEGRLTSEKMVLEIKEKAKVLVPWDDARSLFGKGWGALLSRLRGLPSILGPKVNPADDVTAAEIIRQDIERAIADGQKVYEQVLV
jgi:hypothetical protein